MGINHGFDPGAVTPIAKKSPISRAGLNALTPVPPKGPALDNRRASWFNHPGT
jgi:hypothetical protein